VSKVRLGEDKFRPVSKRWFKQKESWRCRCQRTLPELFKAKGKFGNAAGTWVWTPSVQM